MNKLKLEGVFGWDFMPSDISNFLEKANGQPITVEMSSPGGYVFDAFDMFNLIKDYEGETTIVLGSMAISCGSFFPLAFDNKVAHKNTFFMAHKVKGFAYGDVDQLANEIEIMTGMETIIDGYYSDNGLDVKVSELGNKEEWIIGGDALLERGVVDKVLDEEAGDGTVNKATVKNDFNNAMKKAQDKFLEDDIVDRYSNFLKKPSNVVESTEDVDNENKNEKENPMDLNKLKNEHPKLYNEVINLGVAKEKARVTALMVFQESSPEDVKKAIEEGTESNDVVLVANFQKNMAIHLSKGSNSKNLSEENAVEVNAADVEVETDEEKEKATALKKHEDFQAKLKSNNKFGG